MSLKIKSLGSIAILALTIIQCTGVNLITASSAYSANTNPAREYAGSGPFYKGGLFYHLNHIPGQVGLNTEAKNEGKSCSHSILSLVSFGDSSLEAAKTKAAITKVAYVDYQELGIIAGLVYHRFCTKVSGT